MKIKEIIKEINTPLEQDKKQGNNPLERDEMKTNNQIKEIEKGGRKWKKAK